MPSILIRYATTLDMPSVHALVYELALYEKEPEAVVTTVEEYTRDYEAGAFMCQVAEINGEIVGMILYFMIYSSWKGRTLYLDDFMVNEAHRRSGIGHMLFDAFIADAQKQRCRLAKWQVLDWNTPAIQFYEKKGAIIEKDWWNGKMMLVQEVDQ
jgi:GNAT superfamily N-acetyltransferase